MNWAFWFMVLQIVTCAGGAITFALQPQVTNHWLIAWVWFCYAAANVAFALMALKG